MNLNHRTSTSGTGAGVLLVIGSCISLQFGAAFAVQLFPHLGSWGTTMMRLGVACLILALVVRPRVHTWTARQWRAAVLFGLAMGAMNGIFFHALSMIPLGLAVSLEFAGPLLLSVVLSRRAIDLLWSALAAVGLGLLGYEAFVAAENINPLGVVFALIAGGFWSLYILASHKVGQEIDGSGGLVVALGVGALLMAPLGLPGTLTAFTEPSLLLFALAVGLLSSVLPYSCELAALRRLPRNIFSILLSLEPAFAELAGLTLLGQPTSALRWAAIVLLITASIGITRTQAPAGEDVELSYSEDVTTGALPTITGFQSPEDVAPNHSVNSKESNTDAG